MKIKKFLRQHEGLRRMRFRGGEAPPYLASLAYLKGLESELAVVRGLLDESWGEIDCKDFRKCSHHMDRAQQRLHRALKRLIRKHDH